MHARDVEVREAVAGVLIEHLLRDAQRALVVLRLVEREELLHRLARSEAPGLAPAAADDEDRGAVLRCDCGPLCLDVADEDGGPGRRVDFLTVDRERRGAAENDE